MLRLRIIPKCKIINIVLVTNVFIWYFCIVNILENLITEIVSNYLDTFLIWSGNFCGSAFSALIGAFLANEIDKRKFFLLFWILLGVFSSLILMLVNTTTILSVTILASLFGVSFGLGMPVCMGYYSDSTVAENRARIGGIIVFINGVGTLILLGAISTCNMFLQALILAVWRGSSLTIFLLSEQLESDRKYRKVSYTSIFNHKPFLLYFIPWIMFSLVNTLSLSSMPPNFEKTLMDFLLHVEYLLAGIFAILGGFLSDFFGRKRMTIAGFVLLGLGYALLGIFAENFWSWYIYAIVDGMAWGIFSVIFLLTIWGDLAYSGPSEKYYALGGLPYLLSGFLQIILAPYIAQIVPAYAIFSFAAFFLFLAVVPLMYAPETLPERHIRERELKSYIEKAKKIKEKYV